MRDEQGYKITPEEVKPGSRKGISKRYGVFGATEECATCGTFNTTSAKTCKRCGTANLDYFTMKERNKNDYALKYLEPTKETD